MAGSAVLQPRDHYLLVVASRRRAFSRRNELRLIAQTCHVVQRVIDVTGFGVRIVRAGQVATAEFFSQALEPQASSVIQDPNAAS